MKKKSFMGIMLLVAAMILSAGGTCLAQETVQIDTPLLTGASMFYGPVFSTSQDADRNLASGASAFGIFGSQVVQPTVATSGATPFAISRTIKDAAGEMNLVFPAGEFANWSGATPIGSPAVISGETNAFVVAVQAGFGSQVANGTGQNNGRTGVTVAMIDGATMTVNWTFGIPEVIAGPGAAVSPNYWGDGGNSAISPYFPTQLTVWTPGSTLDATGATIYGTSGVSSNGTDDPALTGASVWALTNGGALLSNGGTTSWPLDTSQYNGTTSEGPLLVKNTISVSGISGFVAAPVISGESVFYLGYSAGVGAVTVYQLDKDDLGSFTAGAQNATGGVIYAASVRVGVDNSDRYMPTPVVSGGSIFVVCNNGGVTVYDTQDLNIARTAGYVGEILLGANAQSGVTASPVVYETDQNDPYIIFAGTSAITAYMISDGLSGNSRQWWYNFAVNDPAAQIWGTPAVSNGYLFVPVVNGNNGFVSMFNIRGRANLAGDQQAPLATEDINSAAYASPIVAGSDVWGFSQGAVNNVATAYKYSAAPFASGNPFWTQFKFDAAKTGENTLVDDDDPEPDDDDTCFISTLK
jgi:hypothetical protein